MLALGACQPIRRDAFDAGAKPTPLAKGDVVLDLGRRYVVVGSGTGTPLRAAPDPAAAEVGTLRYASVALTTGETVGADSRTWRRIEDRGWAPRDGLLVFGGVRDAVLLAIELRVLAPPELKAVARLGSPVPRTTASAAARPGGTPAKPGPTGTATARPTPSPARAVKPGAAASRTAAPTPAPRVVYAVVLEESPLRDLPAGDVLSRPPLPIGAAATVVDEAVGVDGQRYSRLEENVWVRTDSIATFASLADAGEAAYRATMAAIAPGVEVEPRAAPGLWVLRREPDLRYLADTVREHKVAVRLAPLDADKFGGYNFVDRVIYLPERVLDADARALAATLAHELTHAWEHSQGLVLPTGAACFEAELRAFRAQATLWERLYGPTGKEKPADELEAEHNQVERLLKEDLDGLKARLVNRYGDQCGYLGRRPTIVDRPTATAAVTPPPGKPGPTAAAPPGKGPAAPAPAKAPAATVPPAPAKAPAATAAPAPVKGAAVP